MRLLSVDARTTGRDRAALSALIESADADIACVHNGPHLLRWRAINAAIGRRSGLVVVSGGRPAGGNLVLSSLSVDAVASTDTRLLDGGSRLLPAGATVALLRYLGKPVIVAAATLLGNAAERIAQADVVRKAIADAAPVGTPAVVCAQGVDRPGTGAWQVIGGNRTHIASRIFADPGIAVGESRELDGYVHAALPPLVAELELP